MADVEMGEAPPKASTKGTNRTKPQAVQDKKIGKGHTKIVTKKNRTRLHVYGRVLSFKRSKHHTSENTVLIKVDGLTDRKDCDFYLGKKVVYHYPVKNKGGKPLKRKILGHITRPHGNSGVVRAKFTKNLPPSSFGKVVQIVCVFFFASFVLLPILISTFFITSTSKKLYPSRI